MMDANVQAFRTLTRDAINQPEMQVQEMHTPPSSLRQFFHEFWLEFQSLLVELLEYGRTKSWKKKLLTVLLCVASILVFYDLLFGDFIVSHLEHFVHWMANHSASAVVAFVVIFVISTRKSRRNPKTYKDVIVLHPLRLCPCLPLALYFLQSHFHSTDTANIWCRICLCPSDWIWMGCRGSDAQL